MRVPRQFTFIEIACLALVGVLGMAAFLPAESGARETAMRIRCRDNLRRIGLAIVTYANSGSRDGYKYPRVKYSIPEDADAPKFFTNANQPKSFGDGAPQPNDVTAGFYLILKTQDIDPALFACPSSGKKQLTFGDQNPRPAQPLAASKSAMSNFPSLEYMSYSIENMYPSKNALAGGWKWNAAIAPDYAIAADLNPGGKPVATVKPNSPAKDLAAANSANHDRAGQNVLYGDGRVEFQTTPFAGAKMDDGTMDNIFCRRAGAAGDPVMGPPMDRLDSVLLPTADYKPAK